METQNCSTQDSHESGNGKHWCILLSLLNNSRFTFTDIRWIYALQERLPGNDISLYPCGRIGLCHITLPSCRSQRVVMDHTGIGIDLVVDAVDAHGKRNIWLGRAVALVHETSILIEVNKINV